MTAPGKRGEVRRAVSPLRAARLGVPATLEQVCADLDTHSPNGSSGVTPSMLSGWERGRRTTSVRYRTLLSGYYGQPSDVLFAHQDIQLSTAVETPALLIGHHELRQAMLDVVDKATEYLAVIGSRSRHDATGSPVAVTTTIAGQHPGPHWVLDACLDTAPFGDETDGPTRRPPVT